MMCRQPMLAPELHSESGGPPNSLWIVTMAELIKSHNVYSTHNKKGENKKKKEERESGSYILYVLESSDSTIC